MRLILPTLMLVACFSLCAPLAFAADGTPLREIRILGAERIEPTTVAAYMDLRKGDPLTDETIDRALKSLFATGMFADVAMTQRGDMLEVTIKENPIINEIAFEGNDRVNDESLQSEVQLRPRQIYSRAKVQSDVARIYQIYQRSGRFATKVEPKIIELDQNRVNLVFEIDESKVTKVDSIRFVGNQRFSDDALRGVITTRENRWYSFLSGNDQYDQDRLAFDQEQLRKFYLNNGYADFQVLSAQAEMTPEGDAFYITFTVDEGERYRIGNVQVQSFVRDFNADKLNDEIGFKTGSWYSAEAIENAIDDMTAAMGNMQYAFVSVRPDVQRNRENKTIDVVFQINETPRVFVERIDIHGNVRTQDKVIRRELMLVEGDPFNRALLAKSEKNIRDLGFFEKVVIRSVPGSAPDKTVVDIDIAEQSTGEVSIGAGFSTNDGPLADLRLSERNFLGKGQDLSFATSISGKRSEFDVSFTEPYFLNRDISTGVDAFHMTRDLQDESSYDQTRTGGAVRMGYPLSEHWRQTLKYRYEQNEISNVDAGASTFIRNQEGQRNTSAVSQRLVYDNRDSTLFPTDGWTLWLDTEYAGLGGDASYISGKTGASYYYPVTKSTILNILGETGAIEGVGDDVEINERYFIGSTTLRGFERSGIGPRDRNTRDALGGNLFYRGSAELSFPVGLPKEYAILGHSFTDVGSLWKLDETSVNIDDENSVRASAGVGISWRSPLGPIRLDYAIPYSSEEFDKEEKFRFNFGTRF
jgi:outer membrane protein insertion porin family